MDLPVVGRFVWLCDWIGWLIPFAEPGDDDPVAAFRRDVNRRPPLSSVHQVTTDRCLVSYCGPPPPFEELLEDQPCRGGSLRTGGTGEFQRFDPHAPDLMIST